MSALTRSLLAGSIAAWVVTFSPPLHARQGQIKQTSVNNKASALRPQPTKTGHEIGAEFRFPVNPDLVSLRFRYRYIFAGTAAQGPLSGFWIEGAIGPSFPYGGGDVFGNFAFNLGYEFDPFRDLALTFSAVVQNDLYFFTPGFNYTNTLGGLMRLYVAGHWVFFFEPVTFGFVVDSNGGADFAFQAAIGFSYKF